MGEAKRRAQYYDKQRSEAKTMEEFQAIPRMKRLKKTRPIYTYEAGFVIPMRSDPELKPDKGKKDGSCNRTACQKPLVKNWFNRSTRAYHCSNCAHELNRANPPRMCVGWLSPKELERGYTLCVLEA